MKADLIELIIPFAPIEFRAKDQNHLVYEMFIHNKAEQELTINQIKLTSPDLDHTPLQTLEGKDIEDNIRYLNSVYRPAEESKLTPENIACVFFWLSFDVSQKSPKRIHHQIAFEDQKGGTAIEEIELMVQQKQPILIEPPVRGEGWIAVSGPSNTTGHRRTPLLIDNAPYIPQRFAVDWVKFGPDGKVFKDSHEKNENWYCYGANLYAVADGIVTQIQDGIIENVPLSEKMAIEINLQSAPGNYVLLDVGDENYAFYAHIQPGSILVSVGDKVKSGQVIGKLGNAGNSTGPHLHFHIGHRNSPLGTHGLPYHITHFTWIGNVSSNEKLGEMLETGESWVPGESSIQRKMELILENEVVKF